MTLRTKAWTAFVTAFWAVFWLLILAALWVWLIVLPSVAIACLSGMAC
ncbi:hypothetical protein [Devosia elaeis]|nr:hypothetical protein [Devosia elaeis]